jgi:hypothetical protein
MQNIKCLVSAGGETGTAIVSLGCIYLICVCGLLVVLGLPWFFVRSRITSRVLRCLCDSLVFALIFAPFVLAGDLATIPMPAIIVCVILIVTSALSSWRAFMASLLSIIFVWSVVFGVWNFVFQKLNRNKR